VIAGTPRVVEMNGIDVDAPLSLSMLYVANRDRPGFVGALGTVLGNAGVNIATFDLGRKSAGGDSIALMGIDQPVAEAIMAAVRKLENVQEVRQLHF